MSTRNGKPGPISYGEQSGVSGILSIGANYCARHLRQVPRLTREEVKKLGGIFPPAAPPVKTGRPRKEVAA